MSLASWAMNQHSAICSIWTWSEYQFDVALALWPFFLHKVQTCRRRQSAILQPDVGRFQFWHVWSWTGMVKSFFIKLALRLSSLMLPLPRGGAQVLGLVRSQWNWNLVDFISEPHLWISFIADFDNSLFWFLSSAVSIITLKIHCCFFSTFTFPVAALA